MLGVVRDLSTVAAEEEEGARSAERESAEVALVGKEKRKGENVEVKSQLKIRPGYMYREANWEIGRAAERAKVKVCPFKPGDRFAAWRKTVARKARNAEKRGMRRK